MIAVDRRQNLALRRAVDEAAVAISYQLNAIMEAQNLSIAATAERAGLAENTVLSALKARGITTLATLVALGEALGCDFRPHYVPRTAPQKIAVNQR